MVDILPCIGVLTIKIGAITFLNTSKYEEDQIQLETDYNAVQTTFSVMLSQKRSYILIRRMIRRIKNHIFLTEWIFNYITFISTVILYYRHI